MSEKEKLVIQLKGKGPHNLAKSLEKSLSGSKFKLLKIIAQASDLREENLYIVGGLVRDLFLGRSGADFDLVLEGNAISLARDMAERYEGEITSHEKFGTATWKITEIDNELGKQIGLKSNQVPIILDFVSARSEKYVHPGALPDVVWGDIKEDSKRRDFTINTLALSLREEHFGELHDYWNGVDDIEGGVLRVLHVDSFKDDATRILRILRFQGRLGYTIDEDTEEWMRAAIPHLQDISGARIRNELISVMREKEGTTILKKMDDSGILKAIHASLYFDSSIAKLLKSVDSAKIMPEWEIEAIPKEKLGLALWLMQQKSEDIDSICDRLSLGNDIKTAIQQGSEHKQGLEKISKLSPSEATFFLENLSPIARYILFVSAKTSGQKQVFEQYARSWRHIKAYSDGKVLIEKGLDAGPRYGEILLTLRAAWLDEKIKSSEEELTLLESLINESDEK